MIRLLICCICGAAFYCCSQVPDKSQSLELIANSDQQDSIFSNLLTITNNSIPHQEHSDSLAFLVLPVQASCPSCRKKVIDSIVKYKDQIAPRHYIILSAKGGKKTISSYFKEENSQLPVVPDKIFLDSTALASKFELFDEKPTMYYTYNKKAYLKIASIPATVKEDLHQFFSGKHYSSSVNEQH